MPNLNRMNEVIVVHKGPRKNAKVILQVFENTRVDDIISTTKRKPVSYTHLTLPTTPYV